MFDDPRWGDDPRDRDDPRDSERDRDRDDDDAGPHIGRGPSSHADKAEPDSSDRDDERWLERDRDSRDLDPRDIFTRDLDLPRGREREIVRDRDRECMLRGSESRTLATVGAFRVVSSRDLRDHHDRPADPRSGDLRHLREQALVETTRVAGTAYGHNVTKFFDRLIERGYATESDCLHNRAALYHVHHQALYRAIGQPQSRHRRPVSARQANRRAQVVLPRASGDVGSARPLSL